MLVKSWGVERSSVWSAALPPLVLCHLLKVRDLLSNCKWKCKVAKVAGSEEYQV